MGFRAVAARGSSTGTVPVAFLVDPLALPSPSPSLMGGVSSTTLGRGAGAVPRLHIQSLSRTVTAVGAVAAPRGVVVVGYGSRRHRPYTWVTTAPVPADSLPPPSSPLTPPPGRGTGRPTTQPPTPPHQYPTHTGTRTPPPPCPQPSPTSPSVNAPSGPFSSQPHPPTAAVFSVTAPSAPITTLSTHGIDISSIAPDPFNQHLIYGGTVAGTLLLWDLRVGGLPALSSCPGATTHHAAVLGLRPLASGAVTTHVATTGPDGNLCLWCPQSFRTPTDVVPLLAEKALVEGVVRTDRALGTALASPAGTTGRLAAGTVDGSIIGLRSMSTRRFEITSRVGYHTGPVTAAATPPDSPGGAPLPPDLAALLATASCDGSVAIWTEMGSVAEPLDALRDHCGYVMDVHWSPARAGVLGSLDASGTLRIRPVGTGTLGDAGLEAICKVPDALAELNSHLFRSKPFTDPTFRAASRFCFSPDGSHVFVGLSSGIVAVLAIPEFLSIPSSVRSFYFWSPQTDVDRLFSLVRSHHQPQSS